MRRPTRTGSGLSRIYDRSSDSVLCLRSLMALAVAAGLLANWNLYHVDPSPHSGMREMSLITIQ